MLYLPEHFQAASFEQCLDLIRQHPFSQITCQTPDGLAAFSIPLLDRGATQDGDPKQGIFPAVGKFAGHIARANDIWRTFEDGGCECLITTTSTHSYITLRAC